MLVAKVQSCFGKFIYQEFFWAPQDVVGDYYEGPGNSFGGVAKQFRRYYFQCSKYYTEGGRSSNSNMLTEGR
jgi:hypothetical protein